MAADASTKIQVNFRTPGGALINVYAQSEAEAGFLLKTVSDLAGEIASTEALLSGTNAAATGLGATPVSQASVINGNPADWASPATQGPPPAFAQPAAQPQQQAPAQSGPPAPSCVHGEMTFRSGTGKRGPWTAHFCPTPKGTPNQCAPIWGN